MKRPRCWPEAYSRASDQHLLSRDGGTRTRDLSVPKATWAFFYMLKRTKYQVRAYGRTCLDASNCGRMCDKCSMEVAKSDAIAGHPFGIIQPYDPLDGCPPSYPLSE
jgi:hypothetical protein